MIRKKIVSLAAAALVAVTVLSACGEPYETPQVDTVGPNETAFLVPYDAATSSQTQTYSEDYLNQHKVVAKQIIIPTRRVQTGWGAFRSFQGKLVPTAILIKVDRTPAVRAWVQTPDKGTSAKDESITVESVEGIGFRVGVNASASISEQDAAKFLYYFAGKQLSDVMDQQVREYVQNQLFLDFSTNKLQDDINNKKSIFGKAEAATQQFFAEKGVTIDYVGGADEFTYVNPEIQKSIDTVFQNQKLKDANDAKAAAQKVQNDIDNGVAEAKKTQAISAANGAAEAAKVQGDAQNAILEKQGQILHNYPELQAYKQAGNGWNGQMPQTVINGSGQNGSNGNTTVVVPLPSTK